MRKNLKQAERQARASMYWLKQVMPNLPDLDPHDVHLVVLALLRRHPRRRELLSRALKHG
jgi:hypothetical protein